MTEEHYPNHVPTSAELLARVMPIPSSTSAVVRFEPKATDLAFTPLRRFRSAGSHMTAEEEARVRADALKSIGLSR